MKGQENPNPTTCDLNGLDESDSLGLGEGTSMQTESGADVNSLDISKMDISDFSNIDFESFNVMDLPHKIVVTHVDDSVFENEEAKQNFEDIFKTFDQSASFLYFKSFRRAQVSYSSTAAAVRARIELDNLMVGTKKIKCFFAQSVSQSNLVTDPYLHPPKPEKQFLISPPPSPPEGWEPIEEHDPIIDYELLSALAKLAPGEAHVVHPASDNYPSHPSIIVHICEDPEGYRDPTKLRIVQTRNPTAEDYDIENIGNID